MSYSMNSSSSSSSDYGTNRVLELTLNEILAVIKPSEADIIARTRVIDELKAIVNQSAVEYSSLRGAAVNLFGSYICNLYTRWGDVDISIQIKDPSLYSAALRDLKEVMSRREQTFRITKFIPRARVPLLVVESNNHNNITCDISINNWPGVLKSLYLGWVAKMDDRFRDMVLLVKEWAKSENINNPKDGTLSSYALCLLVIFHFQTCEPPILPPLKEIHPGYIFYGTSTDGHDLRNKVIAYVEKFKRERLANRSSLSELFVSFFQKFSTIREMAKDHAICTYAGKLQPRRGNNIFSIFRVYPLNIEDPFQRSENAAQAVDYEARRVFEVFQKTYQMLLSAGGRDRCSLISSLVRPELRSEILARS